MKYSGTECIILYSFLAILFFYVGISEKKDRLHYSAMGLIMGAGAGLTAVSRHLQSERLFMASTFLPFGVLLLFLGIDTIVKHGKCTEKVAAECIGYRSGRYRGFRWRFPEFRYRYRGVKYESVGMVSCSEEQFEKSFQNKQVTVYIDPKRPERCADKQHSPKMRAVGSMVVGGILLISAVLVLVL